MIQPVRKTIKVKKEKSVKRIVKQPNKRKHKEYGTSKLEERFAKEFLDKLGVEYQYHLKYQRAYW